MISLTIVPSSEYIVAGIPRWINVTSSISCTIFYTLDGTVPTVLSSVYLGNIDLPTHHPTLVVNLFASNGIDTGSLSQTYGSNLNVDGMRRGPMTTDSVPSNFKNGLSIMGNTSTDPNFQFVNLNNPVYTDGNLNATPNGFDANGNPIAFTNLPYDTLNYEIATLPTTDKYGNMLPGASLIDIDIDPAPPAESTMYRGLFDPRARVIFQDTENLSDNDPIHIFSSLPFTMKDSSSVTDVASNYAVGYEYQMPSANCVGSYYNAQTGKQSHYFYDSRSLRWVISSYVVPADHKPVTSLFAPVLGREPNTVIRKYPFTRTYIR